jgi:7-carboxy-7-deazaguanine synthase
MTNVIYRINEVFESIQGEGHFTGYPSVFIRFQGCDVGCAWCDTQHSWTIDPNLERVLDDVNRPCAGKGVWAPAMVDELVGVIQTYSARHIVITGGEPCMYDLEPLTDALLALGLSVQIETSGTYIIQAAAETWVTLSPKVGMKGGLTVLDEALERANEIKHPVARQQDIDHLDALLARIPNQRPIIALQPISQKPRATQLCIETCIARNWRLSVQLHKYLGVE